MDGGADWGLAVAGARAPLIPWGLHWIVLPTGRCLLVFLLVLDIHGSPHSAETQVAAAFGCVTAFR